MRTNAWPGITNWAQMGKYEVCSENFQNVATAWSLDSHWEPHALLRQENQIIFNPY